VFSGDCMTWDGERAMMHCVAYDHREKLEYLG